MGLVIRFVLVPTKACLRYLGWHGNKCRIASIGQGQLCTWGHGTEGITYVRANSYGPITKS